MPHACIGVDVITGFPGESEAHFNDSAAFIANLDVSYLHVFTYSERNNTLAPSLAHPVPQDIRMERTDVLRNLSDRKKKKFAESFTGTKKKVLFEAESRNALMEGFTDNYIQVKLPVNPEMANQILEVSLNNYHDGGWMDGEIVR